MTTEAAPFFHLAQVNVARMRAPIDDPLMADFVAQLDAVNAVADASPGFVWRLQNADGNTVGIGGFDDAAVLVNMSVWESVDALRAYAYGGAHLPLVRARRRWFERYDGPYQALWWIPNGHRPTVAEARERLALLGARGPSPAAFTFTSVFDPPPAPTAAPSPAASSDDRASIDYDGRVLAMVANSAAGDCTPDTLFRYHQRGARVWATYEGPTVRLGALVALADARGRLAATYQHVGLDGRLRAGVCETTPALLPDGRLRLLERWHWLGVAAAEAGLHASTLEELR